MSFKPYFLFERYILISVQVEKRILSKKTSMNKIAHNISVRDTSQNDFIKIEITSTVFNLFHEIFRID